jgi:hypothetical protein
MANFGIFVLKEIKVFKMVIKELIFETRFHYDEFF